MTRKVLHMSRLILAGAAALGLAAGAAFWLSDARAPAPDTALALPGAANAQEADAESGGEAPEITEMTMGPDDAPLTFIEYASFTCPHCASFHQDQFKKLKTDYIDTGKIRFVYRDVYFDRFGLWASMVARCGGEGRFFGITDMIYEQQKDWIAGGDPVQIANNLRRIGKVAGLEPDTIEACLNDEAKAKALVAWFQENAEEDNVNSTPTLIIGGETYSNMAYDELSSIIDEKLAGE